VLLTQKEEEKKKKRKKGFKIAYSSLLPQLLSITKQIIHAKEPIEEIHQNKPLSSSLLSFFRPLTRNLTSFSSIGYCSIPSSPLPAKLDSKKER